MLMDGRVCASIRAFEEGYELGSHARALYFGYAGDPNDVERGYLQSRLLVKVSVLSIHLLRLTDFLAGLSSHIHVTFFSKGGGYLC